MLTAARIPVVGFAFHIIAAFEDEDLFSRRRKFSCESPAAGSGTDDDDVVMSVSHISFSPQRRGDAERSNFCDVIHYVMCFNTEFFITPPRLRVPAV